MGGETRPMMWLFSLSFAKGLPRVVIFVMALVLFRQLGYRPVETLCGVSLFYLPWVLKVRWKPFIDSTLPYYKWIFITQFLLSFTFAFMGFLLPVRWQTWCLLVVVSWLTAVHNVAVDGFARVYPLSSHYSVLQELFRKFSMFVGQGMLMVLVGNLQVIYRSNMFYSWRLLFYLLSALYMLLLVWHICTLPHRREVIDEGADGTSTVMQAWRGSIVFLLCYAFAQGMVSKVSLLFLIDSSRNGGIGLSPQEFGFVMGLVGITALTVGGLLGNKALEHYGFFRCLLPMTLIMMVPCGIYAMLSYWQPLELLVVGSCVLTEQLAYGFGFALYLSYLKHTDYREQGKSMMALSLLLGCLTSGLLLQFLGYNGFFVLALALSLLTLISAQMLKTRSTLWNGTSENQSNHE